MEKRLYKSRTDRKVSGVCGGLGKYFNIDSTLIRIIWALFALTGSGILVYIICALVIPDEPYENDYYNSNHN